MSLETFKELIRKGEFVILDTETTGLHRGEIVSIAILAADGEPLYTSLVKPVNGIPEDASRIHGLYAEHVEAAPSWGEVSLQVEAILSGRDVVVYNAVYDRKMMYQSAEACGMDKTEWKTISRWWCAMEAYAEFYGDWNDYHQSYRWQSLSNACYQQEITVDDAHSALGDCKMTLAICKKLAIVEEVS